MIRYGCFLHKSNYNKIFTFPLLLMNGMHLGGLHTKTNLNRERPNPSCTQNCEAYMGPIYMHSGQVDWKVSWLTLTRWSHPSDEGPQKYLARTIYLIAHSIDHCFNEYNHSVEEKSRLCTIHSSHALYNHYASRWGPWYSLHATVPPYQGASDSTGIIPHWLWVPQQN